MPFLYDVTASFLYLVAFPGIEVCSLQERLLYKLASKTLIIVTFREVNLNLRQRVVDDTACEQVDPPDDALFDLVLGVGI